MRGFPKNVATKQDFINLLGMEEFTGKTIEILKTIYNLDDAKTTKATTLIDPADQESGWNVKTIKNPLPLWKQKGFSSRKEVGYLIAENGGTV